MCKRNIGIELLRILLSIVVVMGHFESKFFLFFSAVPAFFFISFLFTENIFADREKLLPRMKRIIVPYLVWGVYFSIVDGCFRGDASISKFISQLLCGRGFCDVLWFQASLIIITIVFMCVYLWGREIALMMMLIMFVGSIALQYTGLNYRIFSWFPFLYAYSWGRIAEVLPYAICGIYFGYYRILDKLNNGKYLMIATLGIICFIIYVSNLVDIVPAGFNYEGVFRIVFVVCFVGFFYLLPLERLPNSIQKVILHISRYTMGIYIMHMWVGNIIIKYLNIPNKIVMGVVIYITTLIGSIIISKIPRGSLLVM